MKKRNLIYVTCMLIAMGACSATSKNQAEVVTDTWGKYNVGTILFEDKAPETKGSDVYHRIIPDAESYIKAQAREVLATLYNSPDDSIPTVNKIHYTLEDIEGVSAKGGLPLLTGGVQRVHDLQGEGSGAGIGVYRCRIQCGRRSSAMS